MDRQAPDGAGETVEARGAPATAASPATAHFRSREKRAMTVTHSAWTGMVPVEDTELYVTDTGGPGLPVVHLNGAARRSRANRRDCGSTSRDLP